MIGVTPDWWVVGPTIFAALASAAAAGFTYLLARQTSTLSEQTKTLAEQTQRVADETARLARETLDSVNIARTGSDIADQHHQESQSPVLIFAGASLVYNSAVSTQDSTVMNLHGGLWNVGFGVALGVVIVVELPGGQSAGRQIGTVNVSRDVPYGDNFPLTFPKGSWPSGYPLPNATVTISYKNIYNGTRTTTYVLQPGTTDPPRSLVVSEKVSPQEYVARLPNLGLLRDIAAE